MGLVAACGLSSCGAQVQFPCSMWNLPGPRIKPVSPALAGRLLSTLPPGKFTLELFKDKQNLG